MLVVAVAFEGVLENDERRLGSASAGLAVPVVGARVGMVLEADRRKPAATKPLRNGPAGVIRLTEAAGEGFNAHE